MPKRIYTLIFILFIPALAWAAFPRPQGFVNDFANVLDAETKTKLEVFLNSFEKQTGVEVAVATVPSLDGRPVEDYAAALTEEWEIGKKGKDNGILFLVAPNEKRMRIEVGYGLEGAINDALAGRILDESVIPKFKEGDLSGGIISGALAIVDTIVRKENLPFDLNKAPQLAAETHETTEEGGPLSVFGKILMLVIMGYFFIRHPWLFLFFLAGSGRGGGGRGFGGGSGGFGGFGGGLSGGGGASRGW